MGARALYSDVEKRSNATSLYYLDDLTNLATTTNNPDHARHTTILSTPLASLPTSNVTNSLHISSHYCLNSHPYSSRLHYDFGNRCNEVGVVSLEFGVKLFPPIQNVH